MEFGELILILVIVVVMFGATKLPSLGEGLGDRFRRSLQDGEPPPLLLRRAAGRRWTVPDWLLVGAALVLATVVITNALVRVIAGRCAP